MVINRLIIVLFLVSFFCVGGGLCLHCLNDLYTFLFSVHSMVSMINGDKLVDYIALSCLFP